MNNDVKSTHYPLPTTHYNPSFLIQTDTTVGLLSKDAKRLSAIKKRDINKPFLISVSSFKELKEFARVPKKYKKFVRRKKRATFIYPNTLAIRVVKDNPHSHFLKRFGWFYSTSANKSGENFDFDYIKDKVDIIVSDSSGFSIRNSSTLFRLSRVKKRRIR